MKKDGEERGREGGKEMRRGGKEYTDQSDCEEGGNEIEVDLKY